MLRGLLLGLFFIFLCAFTSTNDSYFYGSNATYRCDKMLSGNVNAQAKHQLLSVNGVQLEIANDKMTAVDLYQINHSQNPVTCEKSRRCPLIVSTNISSFIPDPETKFREDNDYVRTSQRTINLNEPAMTSTALRQLVLDRNTLQFRDRLFVKSGGVPVLFYDVVRQCHEVNSHL